MTSHKIGVNLRVSGNCDQGARKYMEDSHVIKFYKQDSEEYEFAYFGVFDGHGGPEASLFCKENLLKEIIKYKGFWTDDDEQVLLAIRKGFLDTHHAMWNVVDTWPKTATGLPSTAGSTSTIAIIKHAKLYVGHAGDSALVLGEHDPYGGDFPVQALCVTKEHKPDDPDECLRIRDAGGDVIIKSGVPRVVWSRPKGNHKGPVRRSTPLDQIPFLAVSRSLGDLWSYDYCTETYVVSPEPDVSVLQLDPSKHRCLVLASDGLWNMLTPEETVNIVMDLESQFEHKIVHDPNVSVSFWSNPAEHLVARALNKWRAKSMKADNVSSIVVLIDSLGPSKLTLLKRKRQALLASGELIPQPGKVACLPAEISYQRSKTHSKNANCSLSDSHIRVTDDSIIEPVRDRGHVDHSLLQTSVTGGDTNHEKDGRDQVFKPPPVKWSLRQAVEDRHQALNASVSSQSKSSLMHSFNNHSFRKPGLDLTKLAEDESQRGSDNSKIIKQIQQLNSNRFFDSIYEDSITDCESYSDSDYEKTLPRPPPSTPCSTGKKVSACAESDGENSLHSSADVTDKAFSLASDESLESPKTLSGDDCPPTPQSAPAKLSSKARRNHVSRSAKKNLAKSGKRLHEFSRPSASLSTKLASTVMSASMHETQGDRAEKMSDKTTSLTAARGCEITKKIRAASTSTARLPENLHQKNMKNVSQEMSPPQRIMTASISMIDVTPKSSKTATRSVSCTGLTPDMSLLLRGEGSRHAHNKTVGTSTADVDVTEHILASLMAAGVTDPVIISSVHARRNMSVTTDSCKPTQVEPLKQLNKSVTIRKSRSKRWGNFLRASKLGIDQMFHLGNHRKGTGNNDGKFATTSSEKFDCNNSVIYSDINTSLSMSKLADVTLKHHHLPDVTVSHLADMTLNTSSLTTADLTNLSALSGDDSMLSAADLTTTHHSMLDASLTGKDSKKRKGFLQKTKGTLRRARKAAKKAFFPENHRLFQKTTGGKRRSDEFLPTPELKRRRQLETEKSAAL